MAAASIPVSSRLHMVEPPGLDTWLAGLPGRAGAHHRHTGKPLVTLAYAQSLDGSLTDQRGRSLALSGAAAMVITHRLRAIHMAILVGIGTVLADDPRLTVRQAAGKDPQPVVLDSRLRMPPGARLLRGRKPAAWIAATDEAPAGRRSRLEQAGASLLIFQSNPDGRIPLDVLLAELGRRGLDSLMVEGGAGVITSFLAAGLVDEAVLTLAPVWVGGVNAVEQNLGGAERCFPRLRDPMGERRGEDWLVWGRIDR